MKEDILAKLHDIKELEKIPDNSVFLFSFLIFLALILIIIIIVYMFKLFKNRKKSDRRKYYEILQNIDFKNSKESAYTITKYSRLRKPTTCSATPIWANAASPAGWRTPRK